MPKIKAYVGAGALIPVDIAKVKTAYSCPWTKRVFRTKRDYVVHLSHLRRTRMHAMIARKRRDMLLEDLRHQISFDNIIRWIGIHPDFIWRNANPSVPMPEGFGIEITYLDLMHRDHISNSHSAPRGGVTNWGHRGVDRDGKPLPTGYPGWDGQIEYRITGEESAGGRWGSDFMRCIGIHTGSGGGTGDRRYGYSVTFWDDDWPSIKMYNALSEENLKGLRFGKPDYFK